MTGRLFVIGDPIAHSLSPVMQQAALDACGIDATYEAARVTAESLRAWVEDHRHGSTLGWNATVPHKTAMAALVDDASPVARRTGSVNTVVVREGRLLGDSTDGAGFLRALAAGLELDRPRLAGSTVVLAGAGGSARAVADALLDADVARMVIVNRTPAKAADLVLELAGHFPGRKLQAIAPADAGLGPVLAGAALLVNTTSVGMHGGPDPAGFPLPVDELGAGTAVYDLVYAPRETPLIEEARRRGCRAAGGLSMLLHQGALAFEAWTGRPAPLATMEAALEQALAGR